MKRNKAMSVLLSILWFCAFALVNYPIGAWAGQKMTPYVLGLPFSVFYFWCSYSLLILAGVLLAWKVLRD